MEAAAASVGGPILAGIVVSLINRYVLDFRWCTSAKKDVCDSDSEDSTPSQSAVNSEAAMTHHCPPPHIH